MTTRGETGHASSSRMSANMSIKCTVTVINLPALGGHQGQAMGTQLFGGLCFTNRIRNELHAVAAGVYGYLFRFFRIILAMAINQGLVVLAKVDAQAAENSII